MAKRSVPKHPIITFVHKHIPELFISLGMCFLILNGVHVTLRDRALSLQEKQVESFQPQPERPAVPSHIFIRWNSDVAIEPAVLQNGKWGVSLEKASYLLQSARPGESGNILIYGHNTREILGNIRALKGGESIELTTEDGNKHRYKVEWVQEVAPSKIEYLQPSETEMLTLYTCSGILDQQRFIVRALPE